MQQAVGVQARTPVQTSSFEMLRLVEAEGLAGTWVLDVRSSELRWSAGLCGLLGLGRQTEPSVAAFLDLIHPQDRSGFGNAAWALASGNRPPPVFRLLRPDGSIRWVSGRSEIIHDRDGAPLREIGILLDVTDREEGRLSLHRGEERLRALARGLGARLWLSPANARAGGSPPTFRFLDGTGADVVAQVHADDAAHLRESFEAAAAPAQTVSCTCRFGIGATVQAFRIFGVRVPPDTAFGSEWIGLAWPDEGSGDAPPGPVVGGWSESDAIGGSFVRAGRELLSWTAADLAEAAGVSLSTVRRLEDAQDRHRVRDAAQARVRLALETAGVSFVRLPDGRTAVTVTAPPAAPAD